jgi:hypothetical protein
MNPKPAILMRVLLIGGVLLLGLALGACSRIITASESSPQIVDAGLETPVVAAQEPLLATPTASTAGNQAPVAGDPCLPAEGQLSYANPDHGYCLVYPEGFTVNHPAEGVTVIHGPDYSGGSLEPLSGLVNIQSGSLAEGRSVSQVADEVRSFYADSEQALIEMRSFDLAGVPAVELNNLPGQRTYRQGIAMRAGRVYYLEFLPLGEEYGQAAADMQLIYNSVMSSFNFLE